MIKYLILIVLVSLYEIFLMIIRKQKKELLIFSFFLIITISLSYLYIYDPFNESLSGIILKLVKVQ